MSYFQIVSYKSKKIVLSDMSNATPKEAMTRAEDLLKRLAVLPPKSALLLIDLTDTQFDQGSVKSWMQVAPKVDPYVKSMAIVGAEKLLAVIVRNVTTNADMKFINFKTRTEAMDWLITQN
jgi:hypothetical protein